MLRMPRVLKLVCFVDVNVFPDQKNCIREHVYSIRETNNKFRTVEALLKHFSSQRNKI